MKKLVSSLPINIDIADTLINLMLINLILINLMLINYASLNKIIRGYYMAKTILNSI